MVASPRSATLGLFALIDEDVRSLMSAWLTSTETSWLRIASNGCAGIFKRNAPCSTTLFVYFEALEAPDLDWNKLQKPKDKTGKATFEVRRRECPENPSLREVPRRNRFSPLGVFRLDASDTGRLLYFSRNGNSHATSGATRPSSSRL